MTEGNKEQRLKGKAAVVSGGVRGLAGLLRSDWQSMERK
jgi:hypothetical protein